MAIQLITPNPNITCTPGLCLVYVRETFGIGPKYPSAIVGWNASAYRHTDQQFPANAAVPIWFTLSDNEFGHVALHQPDGSVWSSSSPTSTAPVHHPSLSDLLSYYGGRLSYLGWTEDVEGVRVVDAFVGGMPAGIRIGGGNPLLVTHTLAPPSGGVAKRAGKGIQAIGAVMGVDEEVREARASRPKPNQIGKVFPQEE